MNHPIHDHVTTELAQAERDFHELGVVRLRDIMIYSDHVNRAPIYTGSFTKWTESHYRSLAKKLGRPFVVAKRYTNQGLKRETIGERTVKRRQMVWGGGNAYGYKWEMRDVQEPVYGRFLPDEINDAGWSVKMPNRKGLAILIAPLMLIAGETRESLVVITRGGSTVTLSFNESDEGTAAFESWIEYVRTERACREALKLPVTTEVTNEPSEIAAAA